MARPLLRDTVNEGTPNATFDVKRLFANSLTDLFYIKYIFVYVII
jgi:hypothetical protein